MERQNGSVWLLARKLRFTYPTVCYKLIRVSPKLSFQGSLQTPDLEKFATTRRSSQRIVNLVQQVWMLSVTNWQLSSVELSWQCLRQSTFD